MSRIQPIPIRPKTSTVWKIGHRGYPKKAPENTLASFEAAILAGADMIEFDVTQCSDGVVIVHHDRTLNRTTNGKGFATRRSWKVISGLDAGSWFHPDFASERIPTLEQVVSLAKGRVCMNIEIKGEAVRKNARGGIEEKVLELVAKNNAESQVVISSFLPKAVDRVKKFNPKISTALLLPRQERNWARKMEKLGADALHLPLRGLKEETVTEAADLGIPVRVYTVNKADEIQKLLAWNVDGIFTDDLSLLSTVG